VPRLCTTLVFSFLLFLLCCPVFGLLQFEDSVRHVRTANDGVPLKDATGTRVVSREYEVKDPGRDTIIILLRLNLAIDELTRTVERLATTIRSVPRGREGLH
jgi:hypothetical protein